METNRKLVAATAFIEAEVDRIAAIQKCLLPPPNPDVPGLEVAAWSETYDRVGGDQYDYVPLPGGQWACMISDASGRGPSAAVVAAILHTLLQSLFRHHGTETGVPALLPKDVLAIANAEFAAKQIERSFVTTFLAIWNSTTATLVYSLAGHNPPLLLRAADRTISELWAGGGLPLGIFPEQSYVQHELRLFSGDVLVLFSDGIVEAEISEGESFDLERLRPALQSVRDGGARGILATLRTAVEQHQKNSRPLDDQTLLVLKVI